MLEYVHSQKELQIYDTRTKNERWMHVHLESDIFPHVGCEMECLVKWKSYTAIKKLKNSNYNNNEFRKGTIGYLTL